MKTSAPICLLSWLPFFLAAVPLNDGLALNPSSRITQYHQDAWTEREGLPQGTVQAIAQTPEGYLWVGTRRGLARFDGIAFKTYSAETEPGLGSSDIRALYTDRAGHLWIGTFNGGLSRLSNGRFEKIATQGLPSTGIIDIAENPAGDLWLGTWNGLGKLKDGRTRVYRDVDGLSGRTVWSICPDARGGVWVATSRALHRMMDEQRTGLTVARRFRNGFLRKILLDREGVLWAGGVGLGLSRYRDGNWEPGADSGELVDPRVNTMLADKDNNLWVGTWAGLVRIQPTNVSIYARQDGLPHDCVECLFEDREGSLWIGTRGGGLVRLVDGSFTALTAKEGLPSDLVKCVLEASDGSTWVGTEGGGLCRIKDGRFTTFTRPQGLASDFVYALAEGGDGSLWVGSGHPAALTRWKNGNFTSYTTSDGFAVDHWVRAIHVDAEGGVWSGGQEGGLCVFRNGRFQTYGLADGLPSDLIRVIMSDRHRDLWIGTGSGLCRYHAGRFEVYTTRDGLAHDAVYCAYEDRDGVIWFGTQRGLTRYREGRFTSFAAGSGLPEDVICCVVEDAKGALWISSNQGVLTVAKKAIADFEAKRARRLVCTRYGVEDGMKTGQCEGGSQPSGCLDQEGRLWLPTPQGLAMTDVRQLKRNTNAIRAVIEEVIAGDSRYEAGRQPADFGASIRDVQFNYTALTLIAPERVRFRHKLEGFDHEWVDAQTRRVARYNKLPPGRYTFRVVCGSPSGIWEEAGAEIAFSLAPRFHQTGWFLGLCALAVVVGGWSFHRFRLQQVEARLSLVFSERNRIARDLHDTLAQGFAGIAFQLEAVATKLTEAPAQAQRHLALALNMVRHSLTEARRSVMNLRSAAPGNGDLASALATTARPMLAGRPVDLQVRTVGAVRALPVNVETSLLRIGQEAITNSLKHARATTIQVELEYRSRAAVLRVQDDGRGFNLPAPGGDDEPHFGLLGMRERARQIGGSLDVTSRAGRGTRIVLEVPVP